MKFIISPQQVELKYFLYSLIIPNNSFIKFNFINPDYALGPGSSYLKISSPDKKIKSPLGLLGWFFYFIHSLPSSDQAQEASHGPSVIRSSKSIKRFLQELKENGYNVDNKVEEYNNILNRPIEKKFIPGTKEWTRDKLKLVVVAILGIIIFVLLLILWGKISKFSNF